MDKVMKAHSLNGHHLPSHPWLTSRSTCCMHVKQSKQHYSSNRIDICASQTAHVSSKLGYSILVAFSCITYFFLKPDIQRRQDAAWYEPTLNSFRIMEFSVVVLRRTLARDDSLLFDHPLKLGHVIHVQKFHFTDKPQLHIFVYLLFNQCMVNRHFNSNWPS